MASVSSTYDGQSRKLDFSHERSETCAGASRLLLEYGEAETSCPISDSNGVFDDCTRTIHLLVQCQTEVERDTGYGASRASDAPQPDRNVCRGDAGSCLSGADGGAG